MNARMLARDVDALGRILGAVLRAQEGEDFYALEERVRLETKALRERGDDTAPMQSTLAALSTRDAERLVRAFASYFQLINLAEEYERSRKLALREGPRKQGIEAALRELAADGHSAETVRSCLEQLDFGITFTAHPTELRRRTLRAHYDAIAELLPELHSDHAQAHIAAHVEALWNTNELRLTQPTVADEVDAGLGCIDVIAKVLPELERDLQRSFARVFGAFADVRVPYTFHSWMGGDRDGNPQVTAEVTRATLLRHATVAKTMMVEALARAHMSLSQHHARLDGELFSPDDEPFRAWIHRAQTELRDHGRLPGDVGELERMLRAAKQEHSAEVFARPLVVLKQRSVRVSRFQRESEPGGDFRMWQSCAERAHRRL